MLPRRFVQGRSDVLRLLSEAREVLVDVIDVPSEASELVVIIRIVFPPFVVLFERPYLPAVRKLFRKFIMVFFVPIVSKWRRVRNGFPESFGQQARADVRTAYSHPESCQGVHLVPCQTMAVCVFTNLVVRPI